MTACPELSIVVPMYEEAEVAPRMIDALRRTLGGLGRSFEIVCVDDGSADGTAEVLARLASEDPAIIPVVFTRNFGKEAALAAGLDAARGRAVILMDADLQHPPELIPQLIARWDEGFDVVNAVKAFRGRESFVYRLSSRIFYLLLGRAAGERFRHLSDFKLLDRQVVDALAACGERSRFFRGLVAWVGFRVAEVPFDVAERAAGTTKWGVAPLIGYSIRNVVAFSNAPLIAVAVLGFLTTFSAALLAVQTLWNWARGVAVSGFTTAILVVLITGGAVLVALGIVALYLAVLYEEV